jgi:transposase
MSKKKITDPIKVKLNTQYNRSFSLEFKKKLVEDLAQGLTTMRIICELYEVSRAQVYKWIHLYTNTPKGVVKVIQMESEQYKTKLLQTKVGELERLLGQKQINIEYSNKILPLESGFLGYDIKKKSEKTPLNGLENIKKITTAK